MSKKSKFGVAFFASGRGSNFLAVLRNIQGGYVPASVSFILSNNSSGRALKIAEEKGIPAYHVSTKTEGSAAEVEGKMLRLLEVHQPNLLVLAGYMKKIPLSVVDKMKNRVINIHPGLLPAFGGKGWYGMKVHEGVIAKGCQYSGMTIHAVNGEYDQGPIIYQHAVRVSVGETPETLAKKIIRKEHQYLWQVVRACAQGLVRFSPKGTVIGVDELRKTLGEK